MRRGWDQGCRPAETLVQRIARAEKWGPATYAIRLRQQLANLIVRHHRDALQEDKVRSAKTAEMRQAEAEAARKAEEERLAEGERAEGVVLAFLEVAAELLEVAPHVDTADQEDLGKIVGALASWFPEWPDVKLVPVK